MKVIRIIFALYILYLGVYPCSDSKTCLDERKAGIAIIDQSNHDHSTSEQDLCTPFCICSCCAANIQLNHVADITFTNLIHNTGLVTSYLEKPTLNKGQSIWQPPKLS